MHTLHTMHTHMHTILTSHTEHHAHRTHRTPATAPANTTSFRYPLHVHFLSDCHLHQLKGLPLPCIKGPLGPGSMTPLTRLLGLPLPCTQSLFMSVSAQCTLRHDQCTLRYPYNISELWH